MLKVIHFNSIQQSQHNVLIAVHGNNSPEQIVLGFLHTISTLLVAQRKSWTKN